MTSTLIVKLKYCYIYTAVDINKGSLYLWKGDPGQDTDIQAFSQARAGIFGRPLRPRTPQILRSPKDPREGLNVGSVLSVCIASLSGGEQVEACKKGHNMMKITKKWLSCGEEISIY